MFAWNESGSEKMAITMIFIASIIYRRKNDPLLTWFMLISSLLVPSAVSFSIFHSHFGRWVGSFISPKVKFAIFSVWFFLPKKNPKTIRLMAGSQRTTDENKNVHLCHSMLFCAYTISAYAPLTKKTPSRSFLVHTNSSVRIFIVKLLSASTFYLFVLRILFIQFPS